MQSTPDKHPFYPQVEFSSWLGLPVAMLNLARVSIAVALALVFQPAKVVAADDLQIVALTFDDLPMARAEEVSEKRAVATNERIRQILRHEGVPVIGFVTEKNVEALGDTGTQLVRDWIADGFDLGNHGATHADINGFDVAQVGAEIDAGEKTIRPLAEEFGRPLRFYRFAYNHVGETASKRTAIEEELARRGYRLAASTIDTSDYLFDKAYVRARGNQELRDKISQAYLDHSKVQIRYYQALNREVLGRTPPAIMLLHTNEINAATLDKLIALFRADNFLFVSLFDAQSDPAYDTSPVFATRYGMMWGYRWAAERGVRVDGTKEEEPAEWIRNFAEHGILPENKQGD